MASFVPFLLFLHILSAIVAFGPTFAFAIYGAQAGKEPQHANFMARANHVVSDRLVLPVVLSMPVTGLLIVWAAGIPLLEYVTNMHELSRPVVQLFALPMKAAGAEAAPTRVIAMEDTDD